MAAEYKRQSTREWVTFWESKRTKVSCAECRQTKAASYLRHHMERSHSIVLAQTKGVDVRGGGAETYVVSFSWILKSVEYPVEGNPGKGKHPRETAGLLHVLTLEGKCGNFSVVTGTATEV